MPVPVTLAEMDGSLENGNKSVLAKCITDSALPCFIALYQPATIIILTVNLFLFQLESQMGQSHSVI
jgi:hypothetical protein